MTPPPLPDVPAPALPSGIEERAVFRSLFLANPDALLLVDQSGQIVMANPGASGLLGYSIEELTRMGVDALVPDSIRPRHASYREAYGKAPRSRPMGNNMDLVAKRKDGSEVLVEIALSPLQSQGLPFTVAAIRDISAYPRVKQALQRARYSEHLAQLGRLAVDTRDPQVLLEQVPAIAAQALQVEVSVVFLLDEDRQAFRVAGVAGGMPGEQLGDKIPNRPDTPPGFVVHGGVPVVIDDYRSEQRYVVPQRYIEAGLVSAVAVPLFDRGRTIGALTARSRTAQRFGDEEKRFLESLANLLATSLQRAHSEEALNHAQRLESVGQLTGGIAHDFNNLLTVIQGNLQVLEERPAVVEDAYGQQLVDAAMRATRRAAELTSKLLAFSRRQVLQPTQVDVSAMIGSLADMLRRTLDQRIVIQADTAAGCPPAMADPGQLESALLNIAINARDAMPEGGRLSFRCEAVDRLPPGLRRELDDPSAREEHFVAISIADTGCGMPEEVKERVFEPFFTTKGAGRGTGLGLSTVYGFVKQSRGAIHIDSSPGAGTTVSLFIPQPWADSVGATGEERAEADLPRGLKVLLVEDDTEVRKVVQAFLDALGCQVTSAASAEQALLLLGPEASYDLLLTDIALGPGMRGTELAAEAQRRFPRLAILLMSGFSAELIEADRDSPASWELLRKPYSRAELARAMARLLSSPAAG
ncbi:PAS domain S-box protein [Ideonella sp. YS5]|uniref:PAS domain S-box protein n=1 Tax=Ideonella sp. YS5 TaxID=3453714 RepID=UPI003EED23F9